MNSEDEELEALLSGAPAPDTDARSEKAIQNDMLVALSALPGTLWFRNNTGQAWQGERLRVPAGREFVAEQGMVILRNARPVTFGLEGSGDIAGSARGRAIMVEVKDASGRQRAQQRLFQLAWERAGGIYIIARTVQSAVNKIRTLLDNT